MASRTASFQFRGAGADVREVGRALRVGTLLEGSVRKANNHLRVTVQLVEVSTGHHRWSQRFDRPLDDVFAIQDEIANGVAASLRGGALSPREQQALARPQTGAAAYEYYLRGRQCLPRMTAVDLRKSAEMFDRAVALDADYAPAHAGLAMVHATLHEWFGAKDEDRVRAERASAAGAGTGARIWRRRTWHVPARCRCRAATTRPARRSSRRSASIPICSTPTTTTRARRSRRARSSVRRTCSRRRRRSGRTISRARCCWRSRWRCWGGRRRRPRRRARASAAPSASWC